MTLMWTKIASTVGLVVLGSSSLLAHADSCRSAAPSLEVIRAAQTSVGHAVIDQTAVGYPPSMERPPKGTVTLVHGLNNRASNMEAIAKILQQQGFITINVGLTGHGKNPISMEKVTFQDWVTDFSNANCVARDIRRKHQLGDQSNFLIAYSLGALVAEVSLLNHSKETIKETIKETLKETPKPRLQERLEGSHTESRQESIAFTKQILLAPAFSAHWFTNLIKPLFIFPTLFLPSMNMPEFRSSPGTSIAAYKALFEGQHQLAAWLENDPDNARVVLNVPTLLFLSEKDELVSWAGTKRMIETGKLTNWQLTATNPDGKTLAKKINHLLIAKDVYSSSQWEEFVNRLRDFLQPN